MIGISREDLLRSHLLAGFRQVGKEDALRPIDPRTSDYIEVHIKVDRKQNCRLAQLKLDLRLLDHPVLGPAAIELAEHFMDFGLPKGCEESRDAHWFAQPEPLRGKSGSVAWSRKRSPSHLVLTLTGETSFLGGLFRR